MKFEFGTEYQWDLLRFTILDKEGAKALQTYDDSFFSLIPHAIIAKAIKSFFEKTQRVPKTESILLDEVRILMKTRDIAENLTKEDRAETIDLTKQLFHGVIRDGDILLEKAYRWQNYVNLKYVIENFDLKDFSNYDAFSRKVSKAIEKQESREQQEPIFLIKDIKQRQFQRQEVPNIVETPVRQINAATNAGGYAKNSIIVILDKPKKQKTGMLINLARLYLSRRKKVLYIDLENGEDELVTRLEQSIGKVNKKAILSGDADERVQKTLRRYNRLGGEVVFKRFPSMVTTPNDISQFMDWIYQEYGIRFDTVCIDYAALLACNDRIKEDNQRISNVYLELANLVKQHDVDHLYTPHHVTREASKRERTRYDGNDIAKCIDIVRHVQAIWGLNRTEEEEQAGVLRMELVEQRDGKPSARVLFNADQDIQRFDEYTRAEVKNYYERFNIGDDDDVSEDNLMGGGDLA